MRELCVMTVLLLASSVCAQEATGAVAQPPLINGSSADAGNDERQDSVTNSSVDGGVATQPQVGAHASVTPPPPSTWTPPAGLYLKEPPFSRRYPRIAVMFFLGGLSELAGVGVGAITGCLVVPYGPQGCLPAFLYGGLIGGLLGIPVGVATGGYLMDGNGSVVATFAGFLAGGAIDAALLAFVIYNIQTDSLRATFATIGFLLLPNLMSIFAYEMISDTSRRYSEAMAQLHPPKVSVAPLLAPGRAGGIVGGLSLFGGW